MSQDEVLAEESKRTKHVSERKMNEIETRNMQAASFLLSTEPSKVKVITGQINDQMGFSWGLAELIRELQQNELDASQKATGKAQLITPTYTNDRMIIEDTFGGFDLERFIVLGGSDKKD